MDAPTDFHHPGRLIQGHVDSKIQQQLTVRQTMDVFCPRRKLHALERIVVDQFENTYVLHTAKVRGDTYDTAQWVKPSLMAEHGGFTDELLDRLRDQAFRAFQKVKIEGGN